MNQPHRLTRSRSVLAVCTAAMALTFCGCADMMPNDETWEKWSPSNIWYRMQPNQLGRLNEGNGISSDVYYSISDFPERDSAPGTAKQTSNDTVVIKPIENAAAARP
jgi:hypothetical protein